MHQNIIGCFRRTCYIFLLLLLIEAKIKGQPNCKVEYYSTEQGLSHQAVTDIIKDREGFMWFGSWDGINRFDGHHFVSYKSSPGDKSQLGSDRIDQMVEDQADHLWIEAYDRQIYRFNKKNEQFLPLSTVINPNKSGHKIDFYKILFAESGLVWLQSKSDGIFCIPQKEFKQGLFTKFDKDMPINYRLPSNTINIFHKDSNQVIWIGTADGLCRLVSNKSGEYLCRPLLNNGTRGENITAVDEDFENVYFGTSSGKLISFEKKTERISIQKISLGRINAICRSKISAVVYAVTSLGEVIINNLKQGNHNSFFVKNAEALLSIYEDNSGTLWMEPDKFGVVRFLPLNQSFNYFSYPIDKSQYKFIGDRFRVFEDEKGTVWVNMKGGGFGYYNPFKDSIEHILNTVDEGSYHLPAIVFNLFYDKAGILWLRTNGRELVKIVFQSDNFVHQPLAEPKMTFFGNETRGITVDNKGRLWLGTKGGDLYIYKDKKRLTGIFENEPSGGFGAIYTILQDSRGDVWIGTKGNGLFKASPLDMEASKYQLTHFKQGKNDVFGLNGDEIYDLVEDKQGRIWVGSFDEGLCFIEQRTDSIKFVHTGNAFKNYPITGFKKIRHLTLDHSGNIWIGTTDGLLLLDANNHQSASYTYKSYRKIAGDPHSLGNNNVQFIFCDSKQRMWLATSGGGFCHAIGNQPLQGLEFKNYTTKNGMPNDYVLSCNEDKQGNIWVATENGLSKFNPEMASFRNYDSYDGLSKVGFSEAAASHGLLDGQLFFGTTNGYLSFNPELINAKRIAANIVFTQLQINNEDAVPGQEDGVLKTSINYQDNLSLKYNQNIVSIDYAILDYRSDGGQAFAYRLTGFDSVWHNDRSQKRATYTNLPPGNYVFEVKSLSTDLYSNQPYKQLSITIFPPPWKTWWAYLLYALFIFLVLYFIRHYEIVMMRLRNKIVVEQKLATLKMNFFTNVSHELRTPLTLIINPLEKLSKKQQLSVEDAGYVEVARKNANRMVRFINQLLDLRKVQSDKAVLHISRINVVTFVKEVAAHFLEEARSKDIKLEIIEPKEDFFAFVDIEKLDVVIYNLLSNAFKFTPNNKIIRIIIKQFPTDETFSISVFDQGAGVAKTKLEDIFELFHEEEQTKGKTLKGSGIGLALSREFVNLHGGKIWAENNEDGGLSVNITLKLGQKHYKKQQVFFVDAHKETSTETYINQPLLPHPIQNNGIKDKESPLVLLVEDNDELRLFIGSQLAEFYRVETAKDGVEGLEKAALLLPDLIVSDIMMPNLNGIEMLDQLKNDVNTSHIPVVLLSAKYSVESQMEGLKYGADCYITKPFNNEFLIASINNLLRQRKKMFEVLVEKKKGIALSPSDIVVTSKDEAFLKEVIQFVEDKMADTEFSIEVVAEAMAMTHKTFYKKFKSLTGVLPVEFVRDMRLQRAKQLLDSGQFNISEVAYTVGFSNPKYFSTCFKEKFNLSPSDYLKEKPHTDGLKGGDKLTTLNEVH